MRICFIGPEASGKGTQAKLLVEALGNAQYLHFPDTETDTGRAISAFLKGDLQVGHAEWSEYGCGTRFTHIKEETARAMQALFIMNRLEKVPFMQRVETSGQDLVLDRYDVDSTILGSCDGLPAEWCETVQLTLPKVDLYLLLDITTTESFLRRPKRRDRYEKDRAMMDQVRAGFIQYLERKQMEEDHKNHLLPGGSQYVFLNGHHSVESIHEKVLQKVEERRKFLAGIAGQANLPWRGRILC